MFSNFGELGNLIKRIESIREKEEKKSLFEVLLRTQLCGQR